MTTATARSAASGRRQEDRTVGIDFAAGPENTAACVVRWGARSAAVLDLRIGLDDSALIGLIAEHQPVKVGIDSPFGWPNDFVREVNRWRSRRPWRLGYATHRRLLVFRETDRWVEATLANQYGKKKTPQSVSADRLGATAMRCSTFLTKLDSRFGEVDRSGMSGLAVEVYPAGALAIWGLHYEKYKQERYQANLAANADCFASLAWLRGANTSLLAAKGGHYLDALVSALVARLSQLRNTDSIATTKAGIAKVEGAIHLPVERSLATYRAFGSSL